VKLIGVILIVFGLAALAIGGINYTKREKVLDIGPITATTEKHETIPLPPLVGIAAVVAGVVLVVSGAKARA
jgi:uncharacterized membrane protein YidH (DUF202 family)